MTADKNIMQVDMIVSDAFDDFVADWNYGTYFALGSYGSGKSYAIAQKIILKCIQEKRKVLVARQTYESIRESCFDLFKEILLEADMLEEDRHVDKSRTKVIKREAPMRLRFPNGSVIIFKGMDSTEKIKSINGVSIVWIEECSEVSVHAYNELVARVRHPELSLHFILSCNPVGKENWTYTRFFKRVTDDGKLITVLDDSKLYAQKEVVRKDTYYHHSVVTDNPYASKEYIRKLDGMKEFDPDAYRIGRWGRYGVAGKRVLPQFRRAVNVEAFQREVRNILPNRHYFGFDFGFEESYNAVLSMAVDEEHSILYIYDEIYQNHTTDDVFKKHPKMIQLKNKQEYWTNHGVAYNPLVADSSAPKDISYYRKQGYRIRGCKNRGQGTQSVNGKGTRIQNTKKIKRFHLIIVHPRCVNTIRELETLTYYEDKNGITQYDQFNIDPHTFSAIWYGLDTFELKDLKYAGKNNGYINRGVA